MVEPKFIEPSPEVSTLVAHYPPFAPHLGIRANIVTSLDGAAAVNGRSKGLSSSTDMSIFRFLRASAGMILVGAKTAQVERYSAVKVPDGLRAYRESLGLSKPPRLAIIGSYRPDLEWMSNFADENNPALVYLQGLPKTISRPGLEFRAIGAEENDLASVVHELLSAAQAPMLCEGGPGLITKLINLGLVHELCLSQANLLVGKTETSVIGQLTSGPIFLELKSHLFDESHRYLRLKVPT